MTRILGIDPGLQRTGWGVVTAVGPQLSFVAGGIIATRADLPLATRLHHLHCGLMEIAEAHTPEVAAVEETFVNMNSASSLKLAQARGAMLLSLSLSALPVHAYAANLIKKSVVGTGHAGKDQVEVMVRLLLPGCKALPPDAMDALAVAITHAHHKQS
ncbi:MAG: crossover junction endodeoxyribonuclease RuvC [Alphaproteobacteria bacterium]|nr:crossover junction endodeoxyribonuclease RuvC [Alphaproteobacteria bacterium]